MNILSKVWAFLGSIRLYLIAGSIIILAALSLYAWIYNKGKSACELQYAQAALKHEITTRKTYEKIDHTAPDGSDKRSGIEWLSKHVTHSGE